MQKFKSESWHCTGVVFIKLFLRTLQTFKKYIDKLPTLILLLRKAYLDRKKFDQKVLFTHGEVTLLK